MKNTKKIDKKRYYSLIELLLVIVVLVMLISVFGLQAKKLIDKKRFSSEVEKVLEVLRNAQELMLFTSDDVRVVFYLEKDNQENTTWVSVIESLHLDKRWGKKISLPYIGHIVFEDEKKGRSYQQKVEIDFFSKGLKMSKGELILQSKNKRYETKVYLSGYPNPITRTPKNREILNFSMEAYEAVYPKDFL